MQREKEILEEKLRLARKEKEQSQAQAKELRLKVKTLKEDLEQSEQSQEACFQELRVREKALEGANSALEEAQNELQELGREKEACCKLQAEIEKRLLEGKGVVFVEVALWDKIQVNRGEAERWRSLFNKMADSQLRKKQERPNGEGFVYPSGRSEDGRRVFYFVEQVEMIRVVEIFRTHDNDWYYNKLRTKGIQKRDYEKNEYKVLL